MTKKRWGVCTGCKGEIKSKAELPGCKKINGKWYCSKCKDRFAR